MTVPVERQSHRATAASMKPSLSVRVACYRAEAPGKRAASGGFVVSSIPSHEGQVLSARGLGYPRTGWGPLGHRKNGSYRSGHWAVGEGSRAYAGRAVWRLGCDRRGQDEGWRTPARYVSVAMRIAVRRRVDGIRLTGGSPGAFCRNIPRGAERGVRALTVMARRGGAVGRGRRLFRAAWGLSRGWGLHRRDADAGGKGICEARRLEPGICHRTSWQPRATSGGTKR